MCVREKRSDGTEKKSDCNSCSCSDSSTTHSLPTEEQRGYGDVIKKRQTCNNCTYRGSWEYQIS